MHVSRRPHCATRRPGLPGPDRKSRRRHPDLRPNGLPPWLAPSTRLPFPSCRRLPRKRASMSSSATTIAPSRSCKSTSGRLPRSTPAAWLMLLGLYHVTDHRQEFRELAEDFHLHFNVQTPSWEGFAPDDPGSDGLTVFPHIVRQVADLWRKPECRIYLERLLYDNREGRRTGFPLATYSDILMLLQVLDTPEPVDIDLDLVDDGKLDLPPRARAAPPPPSRDPAKPAAPTRARKPVPPDPSASARPVQQAHQVRARPGAGDARPGRKAAVVADSTGRAPGVRSVHPFPDGSRGAPSRPPSGRVSP